MDNIVELVLNAENVRMLVLLAFGFCGYVLIKSQMKGLEYSLNLRIDGVESSLNKKIDAVEVSLNRRIDGVEMKIGEMEASLLKAMDEKINAFHSHLKSNDFAHLNNTIEALTFTLEKNKFLEKEDKEYIDKRLDR
jgi:hypothetical protein